VSRDPDNAGETMLSTYLFLGFQADGEPKSPPLHLGPMAAMVVWHRRPGGGKVRQKRAQVCGCSGASRVKQIRRTPNGAATMSAKSKHSPSNKLWDSTIDDANMTRFASYDALREANL
jgi:hypothetical protein